MLITENENPNLISVDVDLISSPELDVIEDFGNSSTPDTERLFHFDLECPPLGPEDEILQQISNGFEIPMLLDEDTSQTNSSGSGSGSDQGSLFLETFIDPMYGMMDEFIDPLRVWENDGSNLPSFPECLIKEEQDMDTSSASPAPSSESSDNWSQPPAPEPKFGLETPPISPPSQPSSSSSSSDNSPPMTPSLTSNMTIQSSPSNEIQLGSPTNPIMVVSPINLMPINSNTKSDAPTPSLIQMSSPSSSTTRSPIKRVKIIPKPETGLISQQPPLNSLTQQQQISKTNDNTKTSPSTRTIVLSPQDFVALTQQVKRNPIAAPTIKIQTVPANTPAPNKSNISKVSPITVIKTERLVSTPTPKVALAPPQTSLPLPTTGSGRKQELEMKAIKRQQRMIKNRESACLSRKKKKEYVTSLENQITELHKENIQIKLENIALKERLKLYEENASWKRPSLQARKTTVVLVVLLVVSFNLGYSALWTNKNGLNWPEMDSKVFSSRPSEVGNPASQNSKPISSDTSASSSDTHITRALLWTSQSSDEDYDDSMANATRSLTCPMLINQTESLRLDSELRRWIGVDNKTTGISRQLLVPASSASSSLFSPGLRKRPRLGRKKSLPSVNAIELYQSRSQYTQYAAFFDAIHRRDDTFYVVSFSGDHLLLPALAHNKTLRPKMALVLPALPLNESMSSSSNDQITMMQIDCEVINTQMVQLKEVDVPEHLLRHRNTSTAPSSPHRSSRPSSTKSPETRSAPSTKPTYPPRYRPYFVKDEAQVLQDPDQILYTDRAKKYLDKKQP